MIAVSESNTIDFAQDLQSGLFYYGGTHCLATYITFVIIMNLNKVFNIKSKIRRNILLTYIVGITVYSLYLSTLNDNKSQIALIIISLAFYFFIKQNELKQSKAIRNILIAIFSILAFIVIFGVLQQNISAIREFYENNILSLFNMFDRIINKGYSANGSDERIAAVLLMFARPDLWLFGLGMGNHGFYDVGILSFRHFGQSALQVLLLLGGSPFTIVVFIAYTKMLSKIINNNLKLNPIWIALLLLAVTFYNQCLFTPSLMTGTLLLFLSLNYKQAS